MKMRVILHSPEFDSLESPLVQPNMVLMTQRANESPLDIWNPSQTYLA